MVNGDPVFVKGHIYLDELYIRIYKVAGSIPDCVIGIFH